MGRQFAAGLLLLLGLPLTLQGALPLGEQGLYLHRADGTRLDIGRVHFESVGDDRRRFRVEIDHRHFRDHFLSMKEFKCVDGDAEILCHVAYPYPMPDEVSEDDLSWLEHALLFFYKKPDEFGARLRNGIYFQLEPAEGGLTGTPQAIDLDLISAPPEDTDAAPYSDEERVEIDPEERAFTGLSIEAVD